MGERAVPVIVMGGTITTGDRGGGGAGGCLGGVGGFASSAMLARDAATDGAREERLDWLDGRWRCEP